MSFSLDPLRAGVERFLETVLLGLIAALAVLIMVAVVFRKAGAALVWYDEVASILLAWLTFYGAALGALKRAHIGFPGVLAAVPGRLRPVLVVAREVLVVGFFLLLAWAGIRVMGVLGGTALVSLPWVPARVAHSVIPVGATLFIVAELLSLPCALRASPHPDVNGEGEP